MRNSLFPFLFLIKKWLDSKRCYPTDGLPIFPIDVSFEERWGKPILLLPSRSLRIKMFQVVEQQKLRRTNKENRAFRT